VEWVDVSAHPSDFPVGDKLLLFLLHVLDNPYMLDAKTFSSSRSAATKFCIRTEVCTQCSTGGGSLSGTVSPLVGCGCHEGVPALARTSVCAETRLGAKSQTITSCCAFSFTWCPKRLRGSATRA